MQNAELWRIFSLKVENLHSIFGLDALCIRLIRLTFRWINVKIKISNHLEDGMKNLVRLMSLILCLCMLMPMSIFGYATNVVQNPAVTMPKGTPFVDGNIEILYNK